MSFISQIITENVDRLYYVCGDDLRGNSFWYFIFVQVGKAPSFRELQKGENVDLAHYSSVIKCGAGTEAPPEIVEQMKRKYNCQF